MTVVLGAAYLTLQAHQRNRLRQAETLRAQTYTLQSLTYVPASAPPPRTVAEELALLEHQQELLARARANRAARLGRGAGGEDGGAGGFLERAKDRWNAEVEGAVRWAANKDWTAAREDAEDTAARLWARATGGEPPAATARRAGTAVAGGAGEAARQTGWAAGQAREAAGSAWERSVRKGKEVAAQAKAAVGLAEQKAERATGELVAAVKAAEEEALLQRRYQRDPEKVLNQSVEEALAERYKPVERQDSSKLRGV